MKGLNLFLATCFVVPVFDGAVAATAKNSPRTTITRSQSNTTQNTTPRKNATITKQRGATTQKNDNKNIIQRQVKNTVIPEKQRSLQSNRSAPVVARTAKKQPVVQRIADKTTAPTTRIVAREATNQQPQTVKNRESIMNRDFNKCKSVFFECMDEFCANKDAQLKRCACSTRANDFKATQKSLDKVENNLLDFSQRLLKVNMDPADAAVINQESEGEAAYNATKDKTASKKLLDNISKKLDSGFNSTDNASTNSSALTWSLDVDSAFDSIDSLGGVATSAKSGTALRNAALPICREMASEVCNDDDKSLVETSYNMVIEQDCNTVQRAYEAQTQKARTKVLESGALLDMTRLNTYQENNSDDILECKSKMLESLSHTTVCGKDLIKCLDISGRYINPTTGEVVLTSELVNLSTLITRPEGNETWANKPQNSSFVSYLYSKKKYITGSLKNCQNIADDVWNDFVENALAKIKLAQDAKLEEIRTSCTTLMSDCLDAATKNLEDFDSRALSIFGVMTDKTANALCEDVKTSCAAVLEYTPETNGATSTIAAIGAKWTQGITDISAQETYNTILKTCNEIGRNCIINACKSVNGNFGLCESIHNSINRHTILTHAACWNEVYNCVAQASDESMTNIHELLPNYGIAPQALYSTMYSLPNTSVRIYDICRDQSVTMPDGSSKPCSPMSGNISDPDEASVECYRCRIAEQIWGNCKHKPDGNTENSILIPLDPNNSTLLSWFAKNTHTQDEPDSCAISMCPTGKVAVTIGTTAICIEPSKVLQCPETANSDTTNILCRNQMSIVSGSIYNCCPTDTFDKWDNCCRNGVSSEIIPHGSSDVLQSSLNTAFTLSTDSKICTNGSSQVTLISRNTTTTGEKLILCEGTVGYNNSDARAINCNGKYIILNCSGSNCTYSYPNAGNSASGTNVESYNYDINYYININSTNPATMSTNDLTNYCAAYNNASSRQNSTSNLCTITNNNTWGSGCSPATHWIIDYSRTNN